VRSSGRRAENEDQDRYRMLERTRTKAGGVLQIRKKRRKIVRPGWECPPKTGRGVEVASNEGGSVVLAEVGEEGEDYWGRDANALGGVFTLHDRE